MSTTQSDLIIMAPNGVRWRRRPGSTSSAEEFLDRLETMTGLWSRVEPQWNWWQEGREEQEHDRLWTVLAQWDHATPPPGGYPPVEETMAGIDAERAERERERRDGAASYDEDRAVARLRLLRAQATAGFMRHVLRAPADPAQQAKAEDLLAASLQEATELAKTAGDPNTVVDRAGICPRHVGISTCARTLGTSAIRPCGNGRLGRGSGSTGCSPCRHRSRRICARNARPRGTPMPCRCACGPGLPSPVPERRRSPISSPGWWDRCPACTH
jgi:hypothetical protein